MWYAHTVIYYSAVERLTHAPALVKLEAIKQNKPDRNSHIARFRLCENQCPSWVSVAVIKTMAKSSREEWVYLAYVSRVTVG